jgi:TRAP-type C4-dicarboxylate transport system permease small subunit
MNKLVKFVDSLLSWALVVLMVVMVLDVTWQVFTRFILQDPSSFTEELATFLLIWIGLLGGAYALRQKAHLGIDIFTIRMSKEKRYIWEFVIYSIVILFSLLVLIWGGIRLVNITLYLNQISAALRIKMGYVYTILPITGALMILYSIYFMVEAYQGLKKHRMDILTEAESGIDR